MKIQIENINNKLQISIPIKSSIENLIAWESLISKILLLLSEQKISLITIDPQLYSIGNELGNSQKVKRNNKYYLINWDIVLSENILHLITESEEFKRGLLFIIISEKVKDIFNAIDAIDFNNLDIELILLEGDATILSFYNIDKGREIVINNLLSQISDLMG
jgi:hypothetical protein